MKVRQVPISQIQPYSNNPRIHGKAIEKVAQSIRQYGFRQPIVTDQHGVIIIGHARYYAARKLGLTHVPVHVAGDLSPAKVQALRIADNRIHEESRWDLELLQQELADLNAIGFVLQLTGFSGHELAQLGSDEVS